MSRSPKMVTGLILALGVSVLSAGMALAATSTAKGGTKGGTKGAAKPKAAAHVSLTPIVLPAGKLNWVDQPGGAPGVKMAILWGDPNKGPFGVLHKFPAGFKSPLHTHSAELHCVVVSGTIIHSPEGGPEVRMGPGSFLYLPHTYKHTTACDKASECVVFVHGRDQFDIVPAGG